MKGLFRSGLFAGRLFLPGLFGGGGGVAPGPAPPAAAVVDQDTMQAVVAAWNAAGALAALDAADDDTAAAVLALWNAAGDLQPLASVDDDSLRAVELLWGSDVVTLPSLFAGGLQTGRLASPQALPYAQLACRLERRELSGTAGAWHDYRRLSVTVRGLEQQVVDGCSAVMALLNLQTTLTYPSGARFIRWWPDGEVKLQEVQGSPEETTYQGQPIWQGEIEAIVWSVRTR